MYFFFHARRIFSSSLYIELDILCDWRDRRRRSSRILSKDGFRTGSLPRLRDLKDGLEPAGWSGRMGLSGDLEPSGDLLPAGELWGTERSLRRDAVGEFCDLAGLKFIGSDFWRCRSVIPRNR